MHCRFIETSAKARKNVDELFAQLVDEIMISRNKNKPGDTPGAKEGVSKEKVGKDGKKKICLLF